MKKMMKTIFALVALSAVSAQADQGKMPIQAPVPNPSARWGVTSGANLFVTAEALVFKVAQDTLPYAYSEATATGDITDYHVEQDWKWGFRVSAGYNMSHDKWDVLATYTRFNCTNSSTTNDPALGDLFSYVDGSALASAKDEWKVNFNMFDVEQGRQFFVSKYLRVRPKVGLRNVFLDNSQEITITELTGIPQYINNKEHFWGMGVLAGIDTVWSLAQGFSLYGNVGVAGLFGYFNPKQTIQTSATEQHSTKASHQEVSKVNMDLAAGLRWDKNFYQDRYHIAFNFGFEQHVFFNMTRNWFGDSLYETNNGASGRDFTLSGFALGARFDF